MNILDPQGPIGAAEKTILIDSVAIMLAIVLPTIIAIFGFAFWFRASPTSARAYLPDWAYSGRIELVVWAIPALTIILLGGVAWIGAHQLDPRSPDRGTRQAAADPGGVARLEMAVHLSRTRRVAAVNTLTVPAGAPLQFELTSASVMNAFFIPQLGSMIYTMNGMTTRLNLRADTPGNFQGLSAHFSGDGFSDMHFEVHVVPAAQFRKLGGRRRACTTGARRRRAIASSPRPSTPQTRQLSTGSPIRTCFNAIATQKLPPAAGAQSGVKGAAQPAGVADAR